jgi:hypothetical protein
VTLSGNGTVHVLGTSISLDRISNGRATLQVGDQDVSCTEGQSVSAGSLTLTCTSITNDTVELTATRA